MGLKTVNIRIDEELKKQAEILFSDFGMNMTTAFTIFVKSVVRERKIPFEITASEPFYSESNMEHLKKSINQLNYKEEDARVLAEVLDFYEYLKHKNDKELETRWSRIDEDEATEDENKLCKQYKNSKEELIPLENLIKELNLVE